MINNSIGNIEMTIVTQGIMDSVWEGGYPTETNAWYGKGLPTLYQPALHLSSASSNPGWSRAPGDFNVGLGWEGMDASDHDDNALGSQPSFTSMVIVTISTDCESITS